MSWLAAAGIICGLSTETRAQTYTWIHPGVGAYGDEENWDPEGIPEGFNSIVISNGGTAQTSGHTPVVNATIGGGSTLELLPNQNSDLEVDETLIVGSTGAGTILMGEESFLSSGTMFLGLNTGSSGVVTATGSLLQTDDIYIGYEASGTMTLSSNSTVKSDAGYVGWSTGATGQVQMTDSAWEAGEDPNPQNISIGYDGTGSLSLNNSQITANQLNFGENSGSSGTGNFTGGTTTLNATVQIGVSGQGTVETNADISAPLVSIAQNAGSTGALTVSGGRLEVANELHVGYGGNGTFTLQGGGSLDTDLGDLGFSPGATGTANISDGIWNNTRAIFVGVSGTGTLNIGEHGVIESESGYLGQAATGIGTVNMTGGSWNMWNTLALGVNGEGNFNAGDGAQIASEWAQLGLHTSSVGNVQIAGSSWTTNQTLTIGSAGSGNFQASSNSTVSAAVVELAATDGVNGWLLLENSTLVTESIVLGGGSGTVEFDGATLQLLGGSSVIDTLLISGFAPGAITIKNGGLTVNTDGGNAQIASALGGSGAMTKTGEGRLRLATDNTYGGGTSILGGVLELTGNNNLGAGNVELGSAELRAHTNSTISGDLNGGVQLVSVAGNQTGIFSAANGQTLTLSPLDFLLVAGSTMQVGSAGNGGNVVLAPTGATALTATSDLNVVAGTLTAGNSALASITTFAQSVTVAEGATLDFNDELSGGGISTLFGAGTVNTGSSSDTTLTVGSGNFTGLITGSGALRKNTIGTLIIGAGGNIQVDGGVSIDAGTLQVNGTIGNGLGEVEVNAGGTLSGTGLIGPVKLQGGTLAPGNSAGTLTTADLLWSAGLIEFDLGSNQTNSDFLIVGTLEGLASSYAFTFIDNGWQENLTYNLIQFAGTNIVDTSQFTFTNGGGFNGTFALNGNMLQFTLVTIPEPGTAGLLLLGVAAWSLFRKNSRRSA